MKVNRDLLQILRFKFRDAFPGVSWPPSVAPEIERHVCTASLHMRRHRVVYLALHVFQRIGKTFGQRLYVFSRFIFNVFPALSDVLESPRGASAATTCTISAEMLSVYVLVLPGSIIQGAPSDLRKLRVPRRIWIEEDGYAVSTHP